MNSCRSRRHQKGIRYGMRIAKLRNLEWHDLRATFCTRLAIAGYDAFTIKALMGHRDMKTTERYIRAHRLTRQVA
jgi:integrase